MIKNFRKKREFRRAIKKITGFYPKHLDLYDRAFIHRSATYIDHKGKTINNERLEFLGDAILDAIIGDYLFRKYPNSDEGFLTEARSKLVNAAKLYEIAKNLKLENFLITHSQYVLNKKNICSDAVEALIGAVYLDLGYKKAYKFVVKKLLSEANIKQTIKKEYNFKSRVLEYCQKNKLSVEFNTFADINTTETFRSELFINNQKAGEGTGCSKKEAEQAASKIAYEKLVKYGQKKN